MKPPRKALVDGHLYSIEVAEAIREKRGTKSRLSDIVRDDLDLDRIRVLMENRKARKESK